MSDGKMAEPVHVTPEQKELVQAACGALRAFALSGEPAHYLNACTHIGAIGETITETFA